MKILHIAYSLSEQSAAFRLAEEQAMGSGHQVQFLLARKSSSQFIESKRIYPRLTTLLGLASHLIDHMAAKLLIKKGEIFSLDIGLPFKSWVFEKIILRTRPDVVHVHWGGYGFFPLALLNRLSKQDNIRVVVTTHDYHYFTGGCHIPMDCNHYNDNCAECPMAKGSIGKQWIHRQRLLSNKLFQNPGIVFVSPSTYTHHFIKHEFSKIDIRVIHNTAGRAYALSQDVLMHQLESYNNYREGNNAVPTLLMVGTKSSARENKGNDVLKTLTRILKERDIAYSLITVGEYPDLEVTGTHLHYSSCSVAEMKKLYAVADLCIVPSRFETFSQVTLESIQSGTPVVAFDLTGPADIIKHGESGFLVPSFDVDSYCQTVIQHLNYKYEHQSLLTKIAIETIERFSPRTISERHTQLYKEHIDHSTVNLQRV